MQRVVAVFGSAAVAGIRVTVTDEPRKRGPGLTVACAPAGAGATAARFYAGATELPFSLDGVLACARAFDAGQVTTAAGVATLLRDGDDVWVRPPLGEALNFAQPAFAARVLTLSPLDLDGRAFAGALTVGLPFLVVGVATPERLAKASFALWRLRDLLPRVGADAVAGIAPLPGGGFALRTFPEALGRPADTELGCAAGAAARWLTDAGHDEATRFETPQGRSVATRSRAGHLEVGGRVTDG